MTHLSSDKDAWIRDLARGREFERHVREVWRAAGLWTSGEEESVATGDGRKGYVDLWDDANGLLILCEIKDVDWERKRDSKAAMRAVQRHKNQIWKYLLAEGMPDDIQLIIIYSRAPAQEGWAEEIERYLDEWSVNVVWWGSNPGEHWLRPDADSVVAAAPFPVVSEPKSPITTSAPERRHARIVERSSVTGRD